MTHNTRAKGKGRQDAGLRKLFCLIEGDHSVFQVQIASDESIINLMEAVHQKENRMLGAKDLVLLKVDLDLDAHAGTFSQLAIEQNQEGVQMLKAWKPVLDFWPDQPLGGRLHIFVKLPAAAVATGKHRLSSPSADEPLLKQQRRGYFDLFPQTAPSNLAQPLEFAKVQQQPNIQIFCNRPRSIHSTPITLLHPAFGKFVDDCEHYPPDREMSSFVLAFTSAMCKFYPSEAARAQAVRDLIWKHFRITLVPGEVADTKFTTDSHASVGPNVYVNMEGKNEAGSTPDDPSIQSVIYAHHHARKVATTALGSRLPCLHIFFFGPFLGFAGSAVSTHMHYEPLSPVIPFWFSPHDTIMFNAATRIFGAFKTAASSLMNYYLELEKNPPPPFTGNEVQFPYPTTFTRLDTNAPIAFKIESQPIPNKLLYIASTTDNVDVIVKFARSYSKDLHLYCASLDCAPPLLGYQTLDGGWHMIVMGYASDFFSLATLRDKSSISAQLQPLVLDLVKSFHEQDLVHGDLRDTNFLIRQDPEALKIKLVDFDWGGKVGESKYPSAINFEFWRPDGVSDGALITKEHDMEMVEAMFQSLASLSKESQ